VKTELSITRWNVNALIGWGGLCVSVIGLCIQVFAPSIPGFVLLAIGAIGGGITVAYSGPLKTDIKMIADVVPATGEPELHNQSPRP